MKVVATSFSVWCIIARIAVEANLLDDLVMNNWRDKEEPAMKRVDPFYSPFRFPFPFITDLSADDVIVPDVTGFENDHFDRPRSHKPTFSISDLMTLPEMSRRRKTEALNKTAVRTKTESGPQELHEAGKQIVLAKNTSQPKTVDMRSGRLFPKGLSDLLVIFENVIPKTKSKQRPSPAPHNCDGSNCRDGLCEMQQPVPVANNDEMLKRGLSDHFDRLLLFIIPILLGIGTVFFVLELRRIYKKMKKQAIISKFQHQDC